MRDWIKENIIDKGMDNARFWVRMHKTHYFPLLGIAYETNDEEYWVECCVIEERYKLSDGYKITLKPLDNRFSKRDFYQSDFESCIRSEYVIPKKSDKDHVEKVVNFDDIGSGLYVQTEGYVLVQ